MVEEDLPRGQGWHILVRNQRRRLGGKKQRIERKASNSAFTNLFDFMYRFHLPKLELKAIKANNQSLANLALKINAKLGGSNMELFNPFPHINDRGRVMFVGDDVNHPASHNTISPSFVAVVGIINWPTVNHYAAKVRPELHRQEKIVNIRKICLELVETYAHLNRVRPEKLVLFRDGVSESQFDMVLNKELHDLKKAGFLRE